MTNVSLRGRLLSIQLAWARTTDGCSESQLRASTKKRTIALSAAVSALPGHVAHEHSHLAAGQRQAP